jgi:NADH:ubiquinone oxidoreductase subunit F (NADH-binding)
MMASRGMGDINPSKMPKGKKVVRKDNPNDVEMYKKGGKVNAAGNYTKPSLRKSIVSQVKSAAVQGTGAGQWSGRKAQLVAKKYKAAGGGYK